MKVILREALFVAPPSFFIESLVRVALDRDHRLVAEFDTEKSQVFTEWTKDMRMADRDAIEMALRSGAAADAKERIDAVVVADGEHSDWDCRPPVVGGPELLRLLQHPLTILVENEIHDGHFVCAMPLGVDRDAFFDALEAGTLKIDHGNGSSMRPLIESRRTDPVWRHRTWALFDSDGLAPTYASHEAKLKVAACEAAGIRFHRLSRREGENYIPPSELEERFRLIDAPVDRRRAAGAFSRLAQEQRWHYNLKGGYDEDVKIRDVYRSKAPQHLAACERLQDVVRGEQRELLRSGFGDDIARLFATNKPREPVISEERRRRDGQAAEMGPLFRNIVCWL